jgi:hypothetical protein
MHTGRSVDFLVFASTEGLTKQLSARGQELDECKAALTDFARRLEEAQGELVLQRAGAA